MLAVVASAVTVVAVTEVDLDALHRNDCNVGKVLVVCVVRLLMFRVAYLLIVAANAIRTESLPMIVRPVSDIPDVSSVRIEYLDSHALDYRDTVIPFLLDYNWRLVVEVVEVVL